MLKVFVFVWMEGYREGRGKEGRTEGNTAPSCMCKCSSEAGRRRGESRRLWRAQLCTGDMSGDRKGAHLRTAQVHKEQCVYTPLQGKTEQKHPRMTAQLGHSRRECLTKECSFYKIEDLGGGGGERLRDIRLILNVQQSLCELTPESKLYCI